MLSMKTPPAMSAPGWFQGEQCRTITGLCGRSAVVVVAVVVVVEVATASLCDAATDHVADGQVCDVPPRLLGAEVGRVDLAEAMRTPRTVTR